MPKRIAKLMLYYVLLACIGAFIYVALSGHAQAAETAVTASQGLEGALVDIIQQVSGGVKQGVSFLQQEIPDVVKQLLMWKLVAHLLSASLSFIALIPLTWLFKITWDMSEKNNDAVPFAPYCIFGGIACLVFIGGMVDNTFTVLQIYIAPKVWLIEYAASLVK